MERTLPKGWKMVKLGEVTNCLDGERVPINGVERAGRKGNIPYYGANGQVGWIDDYLFDQKLLLLAEDGGSWGAYEPSSYIIIGKSWVNNHAHVLAENGHAQIEFLNHYFFITDLRKYISGTTRGKLNKQNLLKIQIPLPPLPTQKRIVEILEEADGLRKLRKEADEKMKGLIPSLFVKMFGDPATNPKGWKVKRLGEVAQIISGSTPRTDNPELWDGDIRWVTPADLSKLDSIMIFETARCITKKGYESCSTTLFPVGTVLLSSRAPIGHLAIAAKEMCSNQGFKNLVPKEKVHSFYLYFVIRQLKERLINLGSGATFKEISKKSVQRFKIPLPPLPLQQEFAARVEEIEAEKARQAKSKAKLDDLFNSLMQKTFKGELVA